MIFAHSYEDKKKFYDKIGLPMFFYIGTNIDEYIDFSILKSY